MTCSLPPCSFHWNWNIILMYNWTWIEVRRLIANELHPCFATLIRSTVRKMTKSIASFPGMRQLGNRACIFYLACFHSVCLFRPSQQQPVTMSLRLEFPQQLQTRFCGNGRGLVNIPGLAPQSICKQSNQVQVIKLARYWNPMALWSHTLSPRLSL